MTLIRQICTDPRGRSAYSWTPAVRGDTVTVLAGVAAMSLTRMFRAIAFILALVMSSTPQNTSSKLPDTLPGRLMGEWLAMCAAPKAEQFAKWDAEHYSERIFKVMPADKLVKSDLEDC